MGKRKWCSYAIFLFRTTSKTFWPDNMQWPLLLLLLRTIWRYWNDVSICQDWPQSEKKLHAQISPTSSILFWCEYFSLIVCPWLLYKIYKRNWTHSTDNGPTTHLRPTSLIMFIVKALEYFMLLKISLHRIPYTNTSNNKIESSARENPRLPSIECVINKWRQHYRANNLHE